MSIQEMNLIIYFKSELLREKKNNERIENTQAEIV